MAASNILRILLFLACICSLSQAAVIAAPQASGNASISKSKTGSIGAHAAASKPVNSPNKTGAAKITELYTDRYKHRTPNTVGVFMLPYSTSGQGDFPEQVLQQSAGEMPGITRVYAPKDGADFFNLLYKIQKMGKSIDLLIIGGHAAENASMILFGNAGQFTNADVTVLETLQTLSPNMQKAVFEKTCEQARHVLAASRVMAPNAEIVVLNCYAAKSPEGSKFMRNLAQLLLGRGGGTLYAPTQIVRTDIMPADNSSESMLGLQTIKAASYSAYKNFMEWRVGRELKPGETNYGSSWVKFAMPQFSYKMPDKLTDSCKCFLKEKPPQWEASTGKTTMTSNGWNTGFITFFGSLGAPHVDFTWTNEDGMNGGGSMDRVEVKPEEMILDKYVGKYWRSGEKSPTLHDYKMVLQSDWMGKEKD
jgi:hypothetical protein